MKGKKFNIVIESESQLDEKTQLTEDEAVEEAMKKRCIIAYY